jgi:threonine aldolase
VPFGPGVRFVTHRDVADDDLDTVLERVASVAVPGP